MLITFLYLISLPSQPIYDADIILLTVFLDKPILFYLVQKVVNVSKENDSLHMEVAYSAQINYYFLFIVE